MPDPDVEPLTESRRAQSCDHPGCNEPMCFRVYAAYNADQGQNVHPLHARYPGVMFRACASHVGPLALNDGKASFSTRQWLIVSPSDG